MSQKPATLPQPTLRDTIGNATREVIQPFRDFARSPRALWGINLPYFLEGLVYFGIITILAKFLSENVGLGDVHAGWMMGAFTGGITLTMSFLGSASAWVGLRRALGLSLLFMAVGRTVVALGETAHLNVFWSAAAGLGLVVIGYGAYQPAAYAGVKQFTNERTAALGYAMLYALSNLGSFCAGYLSSWLRPRLSRPFPPNGLTGMLWIYVGFTVSALLFTVLLLTPRTVQQGTLTNIDAPPAPPAEGPRWQRFRRWLSRSIAEHPLMDGRFTFFIFVLIPVQTLFAHNWLTMPLYIERAFHDTRWISDNFEVISNLNPLMIFILTPLIAGLTARANVYRMMIIGTSVMALPTFLLALGPNPTLLFVYIFTMSVGEAIWQPRFLQFAAELAPEGKTGLYSGVAQFPWFLTKVLTSLYSGWFLKQYCPAQGPRHTETMWLFHSIIACISPVALLLSWRWLGDLAKKAPAARAA